MELTRRQMLVTSWRGACRSLAGLPAFASATDDAIAALTGGATLGEGAITLGTPEIAENGNTVPVEVSAPGAKSITLYADGNPVPNVATFNFGPLNPSQKCLDPYPPGQDAERGRRGSRWKTVRGKWQKPRSR